MLGLPSSLERIEAYAFKGSGLASLALPSSINYIDFSAFNGCANFAELTVSDPESGYYIDEETGWLMLSEGEDENKTVTLLMVLGSVPGRDCSAGGHYRHRQERV